MSLLILPTLRRALPILAVALFTLIGRPVMSSTLVAVYGPDGVSSTFSGQVGQQFTVGVYAQNYTDLYAWQFDLNWDPFVLTLADITEGTALSKAGSTFFVPGVISNTAGSATSNADTLLGSIPGATAARGSLAYFSFQAIATGITSLGLSQGILIDSDLDNIDFETSSATIAINSTTAAPEPGSLALIGMVLIVGAILWWVRPRLGLLPFLFLVCGLLLTSAASAQVCNGIYDVSTDNVRFNWEGSAYWEAQNPTQGPYAFFVEVYTGCPPPAVTVTQPASGTPMISVGPPTLDSSCGITCYDFVLTVGVNSLV